LKLTPLEIRKQEFRKTLRGFDPLEVQTFLDMVAEQYEKLLEENKELHRQIIELRTKLQDYQETEKTLRETLVNVQEVKKQSEENSRRQADLIIKEAELKAIEILENARKQARQIREEVNWLRSQKESFINRLRHILISQIELLSVMEMDEAIPEEVQEFLKNQKNRRLNALKSAQEVKSTNGNKDLPEPDEAILLDEGGESSDSRSTTGPKKKSEKDEKSGGRFSDDEINDFIKKGIDIDELIKDINKKEKEK